MGKSWDAWVPGPAYWREALRVLKPGGHLLAFAGSRTQDLMGMALRLAGFEIRDCLMWVFGSGFPKSLDISKAIDAHGGASVAWFGPWFRKWREGNGITQKHVAALFPSKTGGLTGCVANWELGLNMPTPEQFNLIRDTFDLPFQSIEAAHREVIAQQRGTMLAVAPGQGNDRSSTTLDITAPATPEATQWVGWGTALKPAYEPIILARKPMGSTVAACVLEHGTGGLNIDGCRVGADGGKGIVVEQLDKQDKRGMGWGTRNVIEDDTVRGRWPANLAHDGSPEVLAGFPETSSGAYLAEHADRGKGTGRLGAFAGSTRQRRDFNGDSGSAARFYYCSKASKEDRDEGLGTVPVTDGHTRADRAPDSAGLTAYAGSQAHGRNVHPTVKPTDLMRWLVRLVTPPGGVVLDPFCGSGSTGKAAMLEGFRFIGIEREEASAETARLRVAHAEATPVQLDLLAPVAAAVKGEAPREDYGQLDIFGGGL
jgi:hypothetical protein